MVKELWVVWSRKRVFPAVVPTLWNNLTQWQPPPPLYWTSRRALKPGSAKWLGDLAVPFNPGDGWWIENALLCLLTAVIFKEIFGLIWFLLMFLTMAFIWFYCFICKYPESCKYDEQVRNLINKRFVFLFHFIINLKCLAKQTYFCTLLHCWNLIWKCIRFLGLAYNDWAHQFSFCVLQLFI